MSLGKYVWQMSEVDKVRILIIIISVLLLLSSLLIFFFYQAGQETGGTRVSVIWLSSLLALILAISLYGGLTGGLLAAVVIIFVSGGVTTIMKSSLSVFWLLCCAWTGIFGGLLSDILRRWYRESQRQFAEIGSLLREDKATGLDSPQHFDLELRASTRRALLYRRDLALMMVKIDDLAWMKDRYGEETQQYILQEVAEILSGGLRGADVIARYSQDVFGALLPKTPLEGAIRAAERIEKLIEGYSFLSAEDGSGVKVTLSIGVEAILLDKASSSGRAKDAQELIEHALHALEVAEKAGGSRVCKFMGF